MSVYPTLKPTKVQHFYQFRLGLCTSFDRSLRSGKGLTPLETVLRGFAVAPQKTVQYCTLELSAYCKFFSPRRAKYLNNKELRYFAIFTHLIRENLF